MKKIQEEKDIKDNIVDLQEARLALASKEPPKGGNWLSNLAQGTRFLASQKSNGNSTLYDFMVGTDPTKMPAVMLGYELGHRDGGFRWVDPVKFSRDYEFFMTIEVEQDNGSTEIQTGRVDSDGQSEVVHPIHEGE